MKRIYYENKRTPDKKFYKSKVTEAWKKEAKRRSVEDKRFKSITHVMELHRLIWSTIAKAHEDADVKIKIDPSSAYSGFNITMENIVKYLYQLGYLTDREFRYLMANECNPICAWVRHFDDKRCILCPVDWKQPKGFNSHACRDGLLGKYRQAKTHREEAKIARQLSILSLKIGD